MSNAPKLAAEDEAALLAKATLETVIAVRRWTDNLLTFRITRPADYPFVPGHYSRLGLADGTSVVWRAYSVTSAPAENELEYYSVVVPNGAFTTLLNDIKPGDRIWLDKQLFGFMTADRFVDGEVLWLLATGTGIGPYISMLRDPAVWKQFRHLVLVHCVRHVDELAYLDELRALQKQPPRDSDGGTRPAVLHLIQSVTRDDAAANGDLLHGRITSLLENGELEKKVGLPINVESARVMLCGNPAMIEDTRRILHERGMRPCRRAVPGQFLTENYW